MSISVFAVEPSGSSRSSHLCRNFSRIDGFVDPVVLFRPSCSFTVFLACLMPLLSCCCRPCHHAIVLEARGIGVSFFTPREFSSSLSWASVKPPASLVPERAICLVSHPSSAVVALTAERPIESTVDVIVARNEESNHGWARAAEADGLSVASLVTSCVTRSQPPPPRASRVWKPSANCAYSLPPFFSTDLQREARGEGRGARGEGKNAKHE